jgi:hypothetical protein
VCNWWPYMHCPVEGFLCMICVWDLCSFFHIDSFFMSNFSLFWTDCVLMILLSGLQGRREVPFQWFWPSCYDTWHIGHPCQIWIECEVVCFWFLVFSYDLLYAGKVYFHLYVQSWNKMDRKLASTAKIVPSVSVIFYAHFLYFQNFSPNKIHYI